MKQPRSLCTVLLLSITPLACGSEVISSSSGETAAPPGSSSPTGAGGQGGGGGQDPGPPPAPCVPQPEGTGGILINPTCSDISGLSVSDPTLVDENGNGLFEAGETATLSIKLNETTGTSFMWYPGVLFESDHPGATVPAEYWFYGIFGCQSHDISVPVSLAASLSKNTNIHITARVGMLNQQCPNTSSLAIPINIQ